MNCASTSNSSENSQELQRLQEQLQESQAQVSLLRRTNECLCHENTDLRQGRDALMTRLKLLEAALERYQESQATAMLPQGNGSGAAELLDQLLPESDRWLLQTSRADYAHLKDLLAEKAWEEADVETQQIMLSIAGEDAQGQGFLTADQITEFPCLDLKILNKLWTIYSNGKYGFMIQRDIWDRTHQSTRNFWHSPEFDGYYPRREGLGYSLAKRLLRCALDDF
jgi:regulator of replication initiation timing